ncbi:hypothetical protein D3C72_1832930 [compost metagenome]
MSVNEVKESTSYFVESVWKGKKSPRSKVLVKVFDKVEKPKGAKVKFDKKLGKIRITLEEKSDDRYNYLWCNEDGTLLYEWDDFNGEYVRPKGSNNQFILNKSNTKSKVYVLKVNKLTTCRSERLEIIIPKF